MFFLWSDFLCWCSSFSSGMETFFIDLFLLVVKPRVESHKIILVKVSSNIVGWKSQALSWKLGIFVISLSPFWLFYRANILNENIVRIKNILQDQENFLIRSLLTPHSHDVLCLSLTKAWHFVMNRFVLFKTISSGTFRLCFLSHLVLQMNFMWSKCLRE